MIITFLLDVKDYEINPIVIQGFIFLSSVEYKQVN